MFCPNVTALTCIIFAVAPFCLCLMMTSLRKTISVSFMVTSSSLVPDLRSEMTEGRMHRGGTARRVRIM